MGKNVLYVGLDVHKMSVDVAIAEPGPGARSDITAGSAATWRPWTK